MVQILRTSPAWQSSINQYGLSAFAQDDKTRIGSPTPDSGSSSCCYLSGRGGVTRWVWMTLEFIPVVLPKGHYTFDVTQAREGGSAGAVTWFCRLYSCLWLWHLVTLR